MQIAEKRTSLILVKAGSDISIAPSFGNLNNALISVAALASAELLVGFLLAAGLALGLAVELIALLGERGLAVTFVTALLVATLVVVLAVALVAPR